MIITIMARRKTTGVWRPTRDEVARTVEFVRFEGEVAGLPPSPARREMEEVYHEIARERGVKPGTPQSRTLRKKILGYYNSDEGQMIGK